MTNEQIKLLKEQLEEIKSPNFNTDHWDGWQSSTIIILGRIYDKDSLEIKKFEEIKLDLSDFEIPSNNNFSECKQKGEAILNTCINTLKNLGKPEKNKNKNSGINIKMTQNQSMNISLMSVIKNELDRSQLLEIKKLMKNKMSEPEKKKMLIEKIKSFGNDVASNILANILTNFNIWG